MRKILTSLLVISAVVVSVAVATTAQLSDTEKSTGNAFTVGTIDIAVDNENPWDSTRQYVMEDMKPSYTNYINFEIKNVGNNPANVWKTLSNYAYTDVLDSEPECEAENAAWDNANETCIAGQAASDIDRVINYDMRVELYPEGSDTYVWHETIYMDEDNITLSELKDTKMYLGMIPVNWTMKVYQSYHMIDVTDVNENLYQGDGMTFDMTLYAEQLTNTVRLENKYESNTDLSHTLWDSTYADLTYKVMDDVFRFTLDVQGMADGHYTLVAWEDNEDGTLYSWTWGQFGGTEVLADVEVVAGVAHVVDEVDLGENLTNSKVWLTLGDLGDAGDSGVVLPWSPTTTLFETGLIDYYDSSL